jgi:signal transduction histidine kinase
MEYMREKVLLNEVVNKICADLNITINKKQNHIIKSLDGGVYVLADGGKVEQILINLIGNSMKFTSQGAITLTSHIEEDKVKIDVTDTGSGIPLANQSLLFRKFQQAGSSTVTRDSSQGTGLGLYISRLMAEGMGGTLFLEKSEEGKGSTFCLTLPLALNDNK